MIPHGTAENVAQLVPEVQCYEEFGCLETLNIIIIIKILLQKNHLCKT